MFAKIENNQVVEYPIVESVLRARFPNVSFSAGFSAGLPTGYVKVLNGSVPVPTDIQVVEEVTPTFNGQSWVRTYELQDKYTAEELVEVNKKKTQDKWVAMRDERDERIKSSDWILDRHADQKAMGVNTTFTDQEIGLWLQYRQELRDLPSTITDIDNIQWPSKPTELQISGL